MRLTKEEFAVLLLGVFCTVFSLFGGTSFETGNAEPVSGLTVETAAPAVKAEKPVNLNSADGEELMTLPAIGEKRSAAIIAYREKVGGFRYPEDLYFIDGFNDILVEKLRNLVTTEEIK